MTLKLLLSFCLSKKLNGWNAKKLVTWPNPSSRAINGTKAHLDLKKHQKKTRKTSTNASTGRPTPKTAIYQKRAGCRKEVQQASRNTTTEPMVASIKSLRETVRRKRVMPKITI